MPGLQDSNTGWGRVGAVLASLKSRGAWELRQRDTAEVTRTRDRARLERQALFPFGEP